MFASKSVLQHLARGTIGLGALAAAAFVAPSHPWLALIGVAAALVALRGCPMCWTVGLIQTIAARLRGKPTDGHCWDGSCASAGRALAAEERDQPP